MFVGGGDCERDPTHAYPLHLEKNNIMNIDHPL